MEKNVVILDFSECDRKDFKVLNALNIKIIGYEIKDDTIHLGYVSNGLVFWKEYFYFDKENVFESLSRIEENLKNKQGCLVYDHSNRIMNHLHNNLTNKNKRLA